MQEKLPRVTWPLINLVCVLFSLLHVTAVGDSLKGVWLQIQCGTYVLPDEKDKETAIDGVFFVDPVSHRSFHYFIVSF